MATFRTGADGRAVISSGNRVGAGGLTPNERAAREASYTSYEPPAVQASNRNRDREASYQDFLRNTGRTATNPYGSEGLFSRAFGISPDKLDYSGITPGGIATLDKVNRLAFDQFMNPRDARGNIRGMLREGSPTRYGPVGFDPSQATGMFNRRSGLTIFPEDYSDLGNELGDLNLLTSSLPSPGAEDADAPAATTTFSDIFTPFTTDPDVRNPLSYYDDINTRPQETPVTPGFTRPDNAVLPSVAEVIAMEPMATAPEGRIPGYVDPVIDPDTGLVVEGGNVLPTGPQVIQAIPGGDPGSASITVTGRGPGATSGESPVIQSDILSPENIAEVLELPGRDPTRPYPIDLIETLSPSLSPAQPEKEAIKEQLRQVLFTPEQVLKANQNNATMRRRAELMAQGMSVDAARMQAERESLRARAARLGLGQ